MRGWGLVAAVAAALVLAACSSTQPQRTSGQSEPRPHRSANFTPPGPPHDPWGPYIAEASRRFDVPQAWVRAIIQVESAGQTHLNGQPITSRSGAMGLMQIMPITWGELSRKHGLGDNPHDPRDNILGGTAYIREMYDRFGAPGFAAAYNGGPGRLTEYLRNGRPLSEETVTYVALVAPAIDGIHPNRTAAVAPARVPITMPPQARARAVYAAARPNEPVPTVVTAAGPMATSRQTVAQARTTPPAVQPQATQPSALQVAMRETQSRQQAAQRSSWGVQVGAFSSPDQARAAMVQIAGLAPELAQARHQTQPVQTTAGNLHRARLVGLSEEQASTACQRLTRSGQACTRVAPEQL
ncbi:MAG: transglycosylase SLT domain-containing protein [Alphaproteobacteria bacterium]|nr:transglycosylase SLT domain-containing protein [Alphaproteobacteria bacterium]